MARVTATPILGRDLRPGDLFSARGPEYWAGAMDKRSIGESVYVRTNAPADHAPDGDETVYKITIEEGTPA